ncbi:hypothetical protein BO70DRAFT_106087 [Aspergillus heteromorphus CBS 117.55]|uniref:Uncharacterized protein n=1 Tax=Aspergillus heteromorphus CBS 117.55 TaxID=1448321 RepID=A0A317VJ98_9EURO|nr:uncharacterized protein BO70DRAFT_106087 [Aspergillus heteromorphus CBS 117.55]PWY74413.1 hypothetical protein BO70DRAFT_106087 [Aspergillus heteromorphus CBS 117.55]
MSGLRTTVYWHSHSVPSLDVYRSCNLSSLGSILLISQVVHHQFYCGGILGWAYDLRQQLWAHGFMAMSQLHTTTMRLSLLRNRLFHLISFHELPVTGRGSKLTQEPFWLGLLGVYTPWPSRCDPGTRGSQHGVSNYTSSDLGISCPGTCCLAVEHIHQPWKPLGKSQQKERLLLILRVGLCWIHPWH